MAKTYWTIENVGVADGDEAAIADWGIDDVEASFTSQGEDEATISANGRRMDAAYLFPYKSTVIIRKDRVLDNEGAFSGGSAWFTGIVAHPHVGASGRREFQQCSIIGPWWYLDEMVFQQSYKEFVSLIDGEPTFTIKNKARIFLNLALGEYGQVTPEKLTSGEQLAEALQWALKPFTDYATAPPFQIGTIGLDVDPPVDEVKNITCAEAVRKMLRWSPDAAAWFDHSTSPPTFHVKRRADLAVFNLDIGVQPPVSMSVTPRFDLQRPAVRIQYERTNSDGGQTWEQVIEDVYPDPPPTGALNQFTGLPFVIDLRGYTRVAPSVVTIGVETVNATATAWWLTKHPDLQDAIDRGVIKPGGVTIDSTSIRYLGEDNTVLPSLPYANQLISGQPADWVPASFQRITITGSADISKADDSVIKKKTLSLQCTVTNATSGTYSAGGSIDQGDPVPVNLARDFYDAVSFVPYEGKLSFLTEQFTGLPALGNKLNILGTDNVDWPAMNTIVQRVTQNVGRRTTLVEFGTPPHLDLGDMVSLLRVTRNRDPQNPYSMRVGGGGGSSTSGLSAQTARQNSTNAAGRYETFVVQKNELVGGAEVMKGKIVHNPDSFETLWYQGISPKVRVRTTDIPPASGQAQFREFHFFDSTDNCKHYKCWILMTIPEEVVA